MIVLEPAIAHANRAAVATRNAGDFEGFGIATIDPLWG